MWIRVVREEKIAFKCILNLCFLFFHITQNAEFICDKNKILIGVKFKNKWVFGQIALGNFKLNNFFFFILQLLTAFDVCNYKIIYWYVSIY